MSRATRLLAVLALAGLGAGAASAARFAVGSGATLDLGTGSLDLSAARTSKWGAASPRAASAGARPGM